MAMTDKKIIEVLDRYEKILSEYSVGIQPVRCDTTASCLAIRPVARFAHLLQMVVQMRLFLVEGRREKLMRWLGFLQGVLWREGIFTLEELASHNMPTEPELPEPSRVEKLRTSGGLEIPTDAAGNPLPDNPEKYIR